MSSDASPVPERNPIDRSATLGDRVKARVALAQQILDNHAREADRDKRLRPTRSKAPKASLTSNSEAEREVQSLRKVYREMRTLYRSYRRETGSAVVPELRSAVHAFKRGESLASLVQIAVFLDDRKLLAW
jgi:hypothetical protein